MVIIIIIIIVCHRIEGTVVLLSTLNRHISIDFYHEIVM